MSIAIDNFINVSLTKRTAVDTSVLRYDTVVWVKNADIATGGYVTLSGGTGDSKTRGTKENPYALNDFTDDTDFITWATIFFNNGGVYIHRVAKLVDFGINLLDGTKVHNLKYYTLSDGDTSKAVELPINEVILAGTLTGLTASNYVGVYQKIFLNQVTATTVPSPSGEGIAVMYKASTAYIAAYLAKLRISASNSVKDLMFTAVTMTLADMPNALEDNNTLVLALNNHINAISPLAGSYRILGGDDTVGNDLTNIFIKITLTQSLYNSLNNLIVTKLTLNTAGINKVKSVISATMNTYIANGYILLDKVWHEDDLYLDGELIAAKGLPIPGGYAVHVAPITQADITNHKIPNIYILYGDQVGVRKIVISGEVF